MASPWQVKQWFIRNVHGHRIGRQSWSNTSTAFDVKPRHTGMIFDNAGAEGAVTFNLPSNAVVGNRFKFFVKADHAVRITPAAGQAITINGEKQDDGLYIEADDPGDSVELFRDHNGDWDAVISAGTWTVETD